MDILALAMANNYTDEKVGGGGNAGSAITPEQLPEWCEQKLVNLDSYGLGQVILGLFLQGGGTLEVEDATDFWDSLSVPNDVILGLYHDGSTIIIGGTTRFMKGLICEAIAFSFMIFDGTNSYTISVFISDIVYDGIRHAASVSVKVS